jgi:glucosyl-dolichyl phosphate glucuronosyltransferase
MKLDILIPTHNRSDLLRQCLDSVLKAHIPSSLEVTVLVVDNRSTDNTKEVVQSYLASGDPIVKYLFVGRPGKSAALNDALNQSDAELVGFLDDDEQIDSTWFDVVHREFSSDADLDFIGGPYLGNFEQQPPHWLPDTYNGAIGVIVRPEINNVFPKRQQYAKGVTGMLMGGNAVIRKTALHQVLPYPETLGKIGNRIRSGMDEVIYHRLLAAGIKGVVVPDLVIYHWIPVSRMTKRYYRKWVTGRGISHGAQLRHRSFNEASLFGVPRYRFKLAAKSLMTMFLHRSPKQRFTAQLDILDCFSVLYGFHFFKYEDKTAVVVVDARNTPRAGD